MSGAWKTISVALEATTAGYVGGLTKASAVTSKFGAEAEKARLQAEKPPSAAGWEAFATKTEALGKKMTKNVTVPILAFGAAAVASAVQLDGAYHTIERRTGATGAKLQGLKKDFDAVNATSGASMSHIADVMSQFNQRLGLSGAPLQAFTKDFLVLERVAGAGAPTVEQAATVMVAWKVATDQQAGTLDKLFVASQRTGVPMNTLIDDVTRFAPQMRAAGMSIDDTTVLMGTLEKAGVPVSKVFMGINTYLSKVAKSGEDTHGAFQKIIDQAAGMDKAGQKVQATTLLVEAFGSRAGLTISQMVADGKLSGPVFDALSKQIEGAQGQIQKVGDATLPLSVRLKQAWKSVELAIAPIGNIIIPDLMGALHGVIPVVNGIASAFSDLPKPVQEWGVGLLAAAAMVGPVLTIGSRIAKSAAGIGSAFTSAGLEVAAFGESAVAELGAVGASIAFIALPLAALGVTFFAWEQDRARFAEANKKYADSWKNIRTEVQQTGVSLKDAVAANLTNDVIPGPVVHGRNYAEQHGLTMAALTEGLAKNGAAWDAWKKKTLDALDYSQGIFKSQAGRNLDQLKAQYDAMAKSTDGMSNSQAKVIVALTSTSVSMKSATTDSELLGKAMADTAKNGGKTFADQMHDAGLTQDQFTAGARSMGQSLKDAIAAFKVDPKAWKQQLDDTYKFMKQVSDNFSASGALTNVPADLVKKGAAGLKLYYTQAIQQNQKFSDNLLTATKHGLNPQAITDLMIAGPEKAGPILEQLAGKHGQTLINMVNVFQAAIAKQTMLAADQARILFDATQGPTASQQGVRDLPQAMQISALTEAGAKPMTAAQLSKAIPGLSPSDAARIGTEFGLNVAAAVARSVAKAPKPLMHLDGDNSLVLQAAIAAKWKISAVDAAMTIDGIPVKAIEALTKTKVRIDRTTGALTLDAKQEAALLKLVAVEDAINSGKGWVNIDADTAAALAKLGDIRTTINGIPFVGSVLAATIFATANAAEVARARNGPQVKNADGNLFESHHAQIAPAGAMRLWAEPETGGEAYIPLHASKRSRSVDIWKKTGMLLGVHGFADGGTSWVDGNAVAAPAVRALGDFITWERAVQAQKMAAAAASSGGGSGAPYTGGQALLDRVLWTIRQTESGNNYGARNPTSTASGAYQFLDSTWHGYGGFPRAYLAPAGVQDARAASWASSILGSFPGDIKAVPITWYTGSYSPGRNYGTAADGGSIPAYVRKWEGNFDSTGPKVNGFHDGGIAWHGKSFDVGGPLWPGWNAVRNDTGRVEHVVPAGGGWGNGGAAPVVSHSVVFNISANSDGQVEAIIRREVIPTLKEQWGEFTATVRRKEASMS